ncbi:hypothetical protein Ciccas_002454 [Cichlidogyrus casuarinus]|uniref:tetrahydrofolate synthase n=1 Tax=Cichlidogyrus casuarinus TaxID=1844966 RepID=A0ABD2QI75_9PLAT
MSRGFKTGLFTSPHLVTIQERIRLNNEPIPQEEFIEAFNFVEEKYESQKENTFLHPSLLTHLMLMAYYYFQKNHIDVAIIEVGLGGRLDYTNHFELITFEKAGIIKSGRPCVTSSTQEHKALDVLREVALEKSVSSTLFLFLKSDLIVVEPLETVAFPNNSKNFWSINASLALEAVKLFLGETDNRLKDLNVISNLKLPGMQQVVWLSDRVRLFLDCAHTRESVANTVSWFKETSPSDHMRLLLFTLTGSRDPTPMVRDEFISCNFSGIYISELDESGSILSKLNLFRFYLNLKERPTSKESAHQRCVDAWNSLSPSIPVSCVKNADEFINRVLNQSLPLDDGRAKDAILDSVSSHNVDILVTGSVYLVGNVLKHLQSLELVH